MEKLWHQKVFSWRQEPKPCLSFHPLFALLSHRRGIKCSLLPGIYYNRYLLILNLRHSIFVPNPPANGTELEGYEMLCQAQL